MTAAPYEKITTANMLELAYLLDRHNKITHVTTQAGWPYGIEELAVTLEGETIGADRVSFCRHGVFYMHDLPQIGRAFTAVMAVLEHEGEDTESEVVL